MIKVVLIGAGNVGFHLFQAIYKSEKAEVIQWFNRNKETIIPHSKDTSITDKLSELQSADIYLISVADTSIRDISIQLNAQDGIVAHTAGSVPVDVLKTHKNYGVFYPLQTFSKQKKIDFKQLPLCLEANNDSSYTSLELLAKTLNSPCYKIDSKQRKALHVAAVFVNNFTNHLYAIGEEICNEHNLPFSILEPLIAETASKVKTLSPKIAQTGPALRNDLITLENHLDMLTQKKHQELYNLLTKSIQEKHG